jgi:pimeloyl-ACP methyl ester carboxylesterase
MGLRVRLQLSFFVAAFLSAAMLLTATMALAGAAPSFGAPEAVSYRLPVVVPGEAPVDLHITELGKGPPLVLLHGIGGSAFSFRHLAPALARTHRVVAIDLKGFGASDKPMDAHYAATDQARLVAQVLRLRGLGNVTIAGHSFGGLVAMLVALEFNRSEPHRIKRLVLMNAPAYPQPVARKQAFMTLPIVPYIALALVPPILTARAVLATERRAVPPPTDREAIAYADPLYDAGARHALIATTRALIATNGHDVIPLYPTIRQPALLIWCRFDPTVPLESGKRLARALPKAQLQVLDQCDHSPAEEQPQDTLATIRRFLAAKP